MGANLGHNYCPLPVPGIGSMPQTANLQAPIEHVIEILSR